MYKVTVNGKEIAFEDRPCIDDIYKKLGIKKEGTAVEINLETIPRSQHSKYVVKQGDTVEIIRLVGGG